MSETSFSNEQIDLDDIPQYSSVDYQPVNPSYPRVAILALLIVYLIVALIVAVIAWYVSFELPSFLFTQFGVLALLSLFLVLGILVWYRLAWCKRVKYALRQHDVILSSGVYWTSQVIQPLNRLQHVEVTQGPLEKRFGLSKLRLFSAGTIASTFIIPGLERELGERLREYVLASRDGLLENNNKQQE